MKKKKLLLAFVTACLALLIVTGCRASKNMEGTWKVQDGDGRTGKMVISKKTITIDGQKYAYKKTEVGFENTVSYAQLTIDGQDYSIIFPSKDDNTAMFFRLDDDEEPLKGTLVYAMSKTKTPDYDSYVKKYMN